MRKIGARQCVFILAIVLAPCHVVADGLKECLEGARTQRAMEKCADAAFQDAQKRLDSLYRTHSMRLEQERQGAVSPEEAAGFARVQQFLQESQEVWVRYRSVNCNLHAAKFFEGTMATLERSLCYARMTDERILGVTQALAPP